MSHDPDLKLIDMERRERRSRAAPFDEAEENDLFDHEDDEILIYKLDENLLAKHQSKLEATKLRRVKNRKAFYKHNYLADRVQYIVSCLRSNVLDDGLCTNESYFLAYPNIERRARDHENDQNHSEKS